MKKRLGYTEKVDNKQIEECAKGMFFCMLGIMAFILLCGITFSYWG